MNLVRIGDLSANRLLLTYRYGHRCCLMTRTNTLATFQMHFNAIHCCVYPQNKTILKNLKYNEIFGLLNNYTDLCPNLIPIRCLSKGKDKLKEKKKGNKPKVVLTDEEMNELIPINEFNIELNKVVNKFKSDLISNLSVRSNPQSIDNLMIDIDGIKHPLSEVANIARKSPQLVVLNLSAMPNALKPVMTAIVESGMNLSPQQEGNIIYLPIPKVTREHREGLANNAKTLCIRAKDELKHILTSFMSYVKKQKKSHVSEELIFNVNENLKFLVDNKIHELEEILEQKLKELLN